MVLARIGIWKCPECSLHQIWKTRSNNANKLDRTCSKCEKRVRTTLDRSSSGKGRTRSVEIWERDPRSKIRDLEEEVARRNAGISAEEETAPEPANDEPQSLLPKIWGSGWKPEIPLEFPQRVSTGQVRDELLGFIAERHDGHLDAVADCWDNLKMPNFLDGGSFHGLAELLVSELEKRLSERLLGPNLSSLGQTEIIPRRTGEVFLERRMERFLVDVTLCLRRIAHYHSITVEDRLQWQRWMIRTRLVDEQLKDLFTSGLPTPDGDSFGG